MDRKMFDTPVLPRLGTILAEVASGDLVVPEFQRDFVWDKSNDDLRLQLLDSIAGGIPIGSLLVWRTSQHGLKIKDRVGGIDVQRPRTGQDKISYLIDGHQRVSTLFGALHPGERTGPEAERFTAYYELGARRPAFRLPPRRGAAPAHWLPLALLLNPDGLFDFTVKLRERGQRDLARDAERLANLFRDYIIPLVPLVSEDLNLVTDAFVRINSLGRRMTEAEMLRALTFKSPVDTDGVFEQILQRLAEFGWEQLDRQVLVNTLKTLLGLDIYGADVREIHDALQADAAPLARLGDVLVDAVKFLRRVGVRGPSALPYTHQLITLAQILAQRPAALNSPTELELLERWFWTTTYTEEFKGVTGGQVRTVMEQLAARLAGQGEPTAADLPRVRTLEELRGNAVRTEAFLLFLARRPADADARRRREEWLATGAGRAVLFPAEGNIAPGNCVLASPTELRRLREALKQRACPPELADEFAIPEAALRALPDRGAFVAARAQALLAEEQAFIAGLGLQVLDEN